MGSLQAHAEYLNERNDLIDSDIAVIAKYLFDHYLDDTDMLSLRYSTRIYLDIKKLSSTGTSDKWRKFVREHPKAVSYLYEYYCLKNHKEEIARCGNKCSHIVRELKKGNN